MSRIQKIRQKIIDRAYYLSSHAEEEMLDDALTRDDVDNAILTGRLQYPQRRGNCRRTSEVQGIALKGQLKTEG